MADSNNIRLRFFGLPIIQSIDDFSQHTHISKYTIFQLSKNSDKYYKTYEIPKKSGKPRLICQPAKKLKGLQSWVLHNILSELKVSSSCKGFEKGTSTADNAEPHKSSNSILTLDIKDFFPSINRLQVYNIFKSIGYNKEISTVLTNLCTYANTLPQGSPCSPKLANLATWKLDIRLQGYVGKRGITYTRYADDLTFSGLNPIKVGKLFSSVQSIIEDENFQINPSKTRLVGNARSKKVTGLVISNNSFGIGNKKAKQLRSKINHLTMPREQSNIRLLYEVNGWLAYLKSIDKRRLTHFKEYIVKLKSKHPDTLIRLIAWKN
jgi:RNA-directed DNA polymerase